jgi:hypothetical protein
MVDVAREIVYIFWNISVFTSLFVRSEIIQDIKTANPLYFTLPVLSHILLSGRNWYEEDRVL